MTKIPRYIDVCINEDLIDTKETYGIDFEHAVDSVTDDVLYDFCVKNDIPWDGVWAKACGGDDYSTKYIPFKIDPENELSVFLYKNKEGVVKLDVCAGDGKWVGESGYII